MAFKRGPGVAPPMRSAALLVACLALAGCAEAPLDPREGVPTGDPFPSSLPVTPAVPSVLPPVTPSPMPSPMPTAPPSGSMTHFLESFESGLSRWRIDVGEAETDCSRGSPGCSLFVRPRCCGLPYTDVSQAVNVALPAVVSVKFLGTSLTSDQDQHLELFFDSGAQYVFDITSGPTGSNNGINLQGPGATQTGIFARWPAANEWHEAELDIDNEAREITVLIRDSDGKPLGSRSLAMSQTEARLETVRFRTVEHNAAGASYRWDELRIAPPGPPSAFIERWDDGFGAWVVENATASVECKDELAGCALRVQPDCCFGGRYLDVSRVVDVPLPTDVSVRFYGTHTSGGLDAHFELFTSTGTQYVFDITNGDNNGIRLLGPARSSTGDFAEWTRTHEWYDVAFRLDPGRGIILVTVKAADGSTVGASQLALAQSEDTLSWLRFRAAEHGTGAPQRFYWDDVRVGDA